MQVDLQFSPEALYAVAERAKEQKTGARGLRSIVVRQLHVEEKLSRKWKRHTILSRKWKTAMYLYIGAGGTSLTGDQPKSVL